MGTNISQLERDIGSDFPANEHYFGLVNVSFKWIFFQNFPEVNIYILKILLILVRQYMLQQFRPTGSLFLSSVS